MKGNEVKYFKKDFEFKFCIIDCHGSKNFQV